MQNSLLLISIVSCIIAAVIAVDAVGQLEGRLVRGTATNISAYPWQVSVQSDDSHVCGGSIYNNYVIITSASCVQANEASNLSVRAGATYYNSGGVLITVAAVVKHSGYNVATKANDIALILLETPLIYSSTIVPIALTTVAPSEGSVAVVSGWGSSSYGEYVIPQQLQYLNVNIISRAECSSSYYDYGQQILSGMICAAAPGSGTCYGDAGDPLVADGMLVGVVSWSVGCAFASYPGVYTNVFDYRNWIANNGDIMARK